MCYTSFFILCNYLNKKCASICSNIWFFFFVYKLPLSFCFLSTEWVDFTISAFWLFQLIFFSSLPSTIPSFTICSWLASILCPSFSHLPVFCAYLPPLSLSGSSPALLIVPPLPPISAVGFAPWPQTLFQSHPLLPQICLLHHRSLFPKVRRS